MSSYDIAILAVVGFFALWGVRRGFIRELFTAVAIIAGVLTAWLWGPRLGTALLPHSWSIPLRGILASILLFLIVFNLVVLIGWLLSKLLARGPLKPLDRFGGLFVGAIKGFLVVVALVIMSFATPYGYRLESKANHSPVLRWTLVFARPFGERYRQLFQNAVRHKAAEILTSINLPTPAGGANSPPSIASITDSLTTTLAALPSTITINLDKLDPTTEKIVRELLPSFGVASSEGEARLDELKASGIRVIEVSVNDLTPETKQIIQNLLANDTIAIEAAVSKINLSQLGDLLNRATRDSLIHLSRLPLPR